MTDHPILMSTPMVLATLREAREPETGKTETRRLLYTDRVAKDGIVPRSTTFLSDHMPHIPEFGHYWTLSKWHRVKAGDRLWIRENLTRSGGLVQYEADTRTTKTIWPSTWKQDPRPSIHMPRNLSRLTLIVIGTKIERLQEITEAAARAEGVEPIMAGVGFNGVPAKTYRTGFVYVWGALHETDSWLSNPWIVAIAFRPILANIDSI